MVCFFTVAIAHAYLTLLAVNVVSGEHHDSDISDSESRDSWDAAEPFEPVLVQPPQRTPFEECLTEISDIITCLYKFSITTRNPTPRDRLEKCADIDMTHFEAFDVAHVTEKFEVMEGYNYLIQRLGKANTKRRQLLCYYKKHHERIVGHRYNTDGTDTFETKTSKTDANQFDGESTKHSSTVLTQTATTISTYVQATAEEYHIDAVETRSEGGFSQTSYASSCEGSGSIRVPDPPHDNPFDGVPFQCPHCFTLVSPDNRISWV